MPVDRTTRKLGSGSSLGALGNFRLLVVLLALGAFVVSGCSSDKQAATTTTTAVTTAPPATITLLGAKHNSGPWVHQLSLRLGVGGVPTPFYICAVRSSAVPKEPCTAAPGSALPFQTTLRLEQRPPGPGIVRPDTPGWGLVGTSDQADLNVVLSDFVSGAKPGAVTYRVTLRDASGRVLATSNSLIATFHR